MLVDAFAGAIPTHDLLAKSLNKIHSEYGIRSNVCRTTTDNGSNFVKTFKVFSEPEASENYGADDNEDVDELDEDDNNKFRAVEIDNLLRLQTSTDEEDNPFPLPPHHRCASHTLNLVATSDCKQLWHINAWLPTRAQDFVICVRVTSSDAGLYP